MPSDRSIRNIQMNHKTHRASEEPAPRIRKPRKRGRSRMWLLALIIVVVAAAAGLALSTVFSGATITLKPRTVDIPLPVTIYAQENAPVGTMSYQTLSVSRSATTTVSANGTQYVQKQASGSITISNAFSTAEQRLIANTRFQAPDGKIYRIHDSVVVPGMQGSTPGTVSVVVYADSPGADYNRDGQTNFTIPGFKGTTKFDKITASGGPITGGFVGNQAAVSQSDLASAKTTLGQQLDSAVRQAAADSLGDGYAILGGTLTVSYGDLVQTPADGGKVNLSEVATANSAMIRVNDLAAAIAKQKIDGYNGEAITFADPQNVQVVASSTGQAGTLSLQVTGQSTTLMWLFDAVALKGQLVGQPKANFENIIKSFEPAIIKADASVRPFWTSTFPSDPNKITVSVDTH